MKTFAVCRLATSFVIVFLMSFLLAGCGLLRPTESPEASAKARSIMRSAYSQMGAKYRLGGASPQKGFDCSGLIYWAYRNNGIKVPRITTDQAKAGTGVNKSNALVGDIVVFRTRQSPRGLHTGIYAGDNNFIHSPGRGKRVCLESMDKDYWQNKLVSIRRIVR